MTHILLSGTHTARDAAAVYAAHGATLSETIRLQKYMSERGIASRRRAARYVRAGHVSVNGRVVNEPGFRITPAHDRITLNGKAIAAGPEVLRAIALHKPRGYICSASSKQGRTVYDLIPEVAQRVVPIGRLDKNSEGLLLMSNDGALVNLLTHPRFEQEKAYHVTVSGLAGADALRRLRSSLIMDGRRIRPARVRVLRRSTASAQCVLEFVLQEGRKRQIRRMCRQARLRVHRLIRVRIKNLYLGALKAGEWRDLTPAEVTSLKDRPRRPPSPSKPRN